MAGDEFVRKSEKSALFSQTHDHNPCLFLLIYKISHIFHSL